MGDVPDGSWAAAVEPAVSPNAGRAPGLSLTGLRVLVEVADRGSFSAAAEALAYTQSAISRQISALEQAVGTRLFERHARGVALTAAGEALVRHAAKAVAHVRAAELEIDGLRDRLVGRLTIGAYPIAAASVLPQAMSRLNRRHPALLLALREASTSEQLRLLRGRRIEVAVISRGKGLPDHDLTGMSAQKISSRRGLGVVVPEEHPLAAEEIVKVEDLEDESWVVGAGGRAEPQFGPWPTLERPQVGYEAQGWPTRLGLVAAGLGVCVLPGFAVGVLPHGVVWRAVHDPEFTRWRETLVVTREAPSRNAQAIIRAIKAAFEDPHAGQR